MPKRDRYADGSVGFVLGVGLALLFLIWDGISQNEVGGLHHKPAHENIAGNQEVEGGEDHYWSSWLPVGFVFTEDSLAQWLMAVFSAGALGVSWLAVVYVRRTLDATREAVKAAEASVLETRRIGEAQTRAYLSCTGGTYRIVGHSCFVEITVKNFGQSPARMASILAMLSTPNLEAPGFGDEFYTTKGKSTNIYEIAASHEGRATTVMQFQFPPSVCSDLIQDARIFFIDCKIAWVDVFDKWQSMGFYLSADNGNVEANANGRLMRVGTMTPTNDSQAV